ncbi:MAG: glycyl-radical enzyme activating protein [Chloroflexota bacterium]|nr:MAG: glycyl-radical enzyme activating protein [Chloroflexota bacterium]
MAASVTGLVFDIRKFSVHDGPGIRTTVFLKGCPLTCLWCHNPESQSTRPELIFRESRCIRCGACLVECPQGAISMSDDGPVTQTEKCLGCGSCASACAAEAREVVGQEMTVARVMEQVERDISFYDQSGGGVTFSGGEPLLQPAFLLACLQACREKDIHTVMDTCGAAPWHYLEAILPLTNLILYDLKLIDDARHRQLTGASNRLILQNLRELAKRRQPLILRVPVIPGLTDQTDDIRQLAEFVQSLACAYPIELLPYHRAAAAKYVRLGREYSLSETEPPGDEQMDQLREILQSYGLQAKIAGQ